VIACKQCGGVRWGRDYADTPQYLGLVSSGSMNPTARVEYALRADEALSEPQVRQIMEYYLAVRMRRFGRAMQPVEPTDRGADRPAMRGMVGGGPVAAGVGSPARLTASRRISRSVTRTSGRY